jgi:sugar phosphate permease
MNLLRVFVPFAFGFFLSYLFRVVNAVIAPDLVRELALDASDLGLLTSSYFLTFAAAQVPLGILLDRYGPRVTDSALLLVAALGALVFSMAETLPVLVIGRALIGFGVSATLMGAFKAYVIWFSKERLPFINGCQMAAGGLGALAATAPVETALRFTDWRGVFLVLAAVTVVSALAIFRIVPEREGSRSGEAFRDQVGGAFQVFSSPVFWRVAPVTVMSQATFLSIQSLWAGPWLRDVGGLGREASAIHLLLIAAATVAGFVLLGFLAERLSRVGIRTITIAITGMTLLMVDEAAIVWRLSDEPLVLWLPFGFLGTSGILVYAVLSQTFPTALAGRVNSALNLFVFVAAFVIQWGIGAIIDLWPPLENGGYAASGYQTSFGLMLALQAVAMIWFFVYRKGRFSG